MEPEQLSPEDQARVDGFLSRGVNSVERKPFKPLRLMFFLTLIVFAMSALSLAIGYFADVY